MVQDRDALERGWARGVDPDYHQTLQEIIGELQTAVVDRFRSDPPGLVKSRRLLDCRFIETLE